MLFCFYFANCYINALFKNIHFTQMKRIILKFYSKFFKTTGQKCNGMQRVPGEGRGRGKVNRFCIRIWVQKCTVEAVLVFCEKKNSFAGFNCSPDFYQHTSLHQCGDFDMYFMYGISCEDMHETIRGWLIKGDHLSFSIGSCARMESLMLQNVIRA